MSFHYLKIDVADVDPEAIRIALREFVQNLANTERDRDEMMFFWFVVNDLLSQNESKTIKPYLNTSFGGAYLPTIYLVASACSDSSIPSPACIECCRIIRFGSLKSQSV